MDVKTLVRCLFIAGITIAYIAWAIYEIGTPDKIERGSFQMWLIITSVVICRVEIWAWS